MPTPEPELVSSRFSKLRRTLKRMAWLSVAIGILAVLYVIATGKEFSFHIVLATFILAAGSMVVATFLMTLIYFSANAGYDAEAHDANPLKDENPS